MVLTGLVWDKGKWLLGMKNEARRMKNYLQSQFFILHCAGLGSVPDATNPWIA
jgi:hypothetical protein